MTTKAFNILIVLNPDNTVPVLLYAGIAVYFRLETHNPNYGIVALTAGTECDLLRSWDLNRDDGSGNNGHGRRSCKPTRQTGITHFQSQQK